VRKSIERKKENRKRRKNPAAGFLSPTELKQMAGHLGLQTVLTGCSFEEQVILSAIIPDLLRLIRTTGLTDPKTFPHVNIDLTGDGPIISIDRAETAVRPETKTTEESDQ
jgi:hypothetical protein